ncbi:unnamed protein product [Bathycoccus prasinos]|jgi:V-type H+-transporting ATPase subunit a|tara:strand:- start:2156 stop:4942 length:2787 start_codon:yes stop_codon:yes gene_type:complete
MAIEMDLFRSEEMELVQLIIPAEAAHDTVQTLGSVGLVAFRDLNKDKSAFQKTYANQVKRCDEMLRKLRFFTEHMNKAGITIRKEIGDGSGGYDGWASGRFRNEEETDGYGRENNNRVISIDELEHTLDVLSEEVSQLSANTEKLRRSHGELVELQLVLEKAGGFFEEARSDANRHQDEEDSLRMMRRENARQDEESLLSSSFRSEIDDEGLGNGGSPSRMTRRTGSFIDQNHPDHDVERNDASMGGVAASARLGFITGTINTEKVHAFERVLFRATRGNVFLKLANIDGHVEEPTTGEKTFKTVYVVFFAGERARNKIVKICEGFNANRYPFPEDFTRQRQMNAECSGRLIELRSTLEASIRHRDRTLSKVAKDLWFWFTLVRREKATYHAMNMFSIDVTRKCLVAEGWCPTSAKSRVSEAVVIANRNSSASVGTIFASISHKGQTPPTYYRTTKWTNVFQQIVEAYGVARYREVNPTVMTIVTFPFLFAVMFGDFGHGIIMLAFAIYMVLKERQLSEKPMGEIFSMVFHARYCILVMAAFSVYTGVLYNECFSVPMKIFGASKYVCDPIDPTKDTTCDSQYTTGLVSRDDSAYPFGVDPVWHGTRSELPFLNSLKMKMSILLGVTQMMVGIFMSLLNQLKDGDWLSVYCEFIPQVVFLGGLFGYLSFLIVLKWITPGCTADLYHVMIYMFLAPGNVDCMGEGPGGSAGCPENKMFPGQGGLQLLILFGCFVAVPVMLFPKPIILKRRHEQKSRGGAYVRLDENDGDGMQQLNSSEELRSLGGNNSNNNNSSGDDHGHGDGEFDFGDVLVHQMIHTIEFVLGAISNTASYLRLWALSLAHAQLSAVFWDRCLMAAVESGSIVAIVIGFGVWLGATLGVLLGMESLSAFLHALRLHWVEYQNKFYKGDGIKFTPLEFTSLTGMPEEAS